MDYKKQMKEFRTLCTALSFSYKGIILYPLISPILYNIASNRINNRKLSYKVIFSKYDISQFVQKKSCDYILFTRGNGIRDNHNIWCDYYESNISDVTSSYDRKNFVKSFCFNPFLILYVWIKVFRSLKKTNLKLIDKYYIFSVLMPFCNTIKNIKDNQFKWVKKYVSFLYPIDMGALFTQYFKLKGIETIALADGAYYNYGENAPFDAVVYKDLISDKILLWGQYSVDEFKSMNIYGVEIKVGGFPQRGTICKLKNPNTYSKCCVLLARDSYKESNIKLLRILNSLTGQYEMSLKFHPLCVMDNYKDFIKNSGMKILDKSISLDECLGQEQFDFTIVVNSNSYYESLANGLPSLRFFDGSFELMNGLDDVFTCEKELQLKLSSIKNMSVNAYQFQIDEMLQYTIGYGINNYRKYIVGNE